MTNDPQKIVMIELPPLPDGRAESGPIRFGNDWPGIFLRGKHALEFAKALRRILRTTNGNGIDKAVLLGLAKTLESCSVGDTGWPP